MNSTGFEHGEINGIRVHVLPTTRFKTFAISLYLGVPLAEDTVTPTALIPFILRRGSETYPETTQFREALEDMYGAGFGIDVYKKGDYQLVQLRMDTINDSFVSSNEPLLARSLTFIGDTLTRPALENGVFRNKYVQAERENVRKRLESVIDDKIRYAAERCIQEMCKDEPYRLNPLGRLDALDEWDSKGLHDWYRQWLASCNLDLYVVGDTSLSEVIELVGRTFHIHRTDETAVYTPAIPRPAVAEVRQITERMEVSQGKLNMGLRTPITYSDERYASALVANGVLGGFPHSKLFMNVREKESLAYYVASRFDPYKGITTIQSGIELENFNKALDIIRQQLSILQDGQITESEIAQTKALLRNDFLESRDSAYQMIGHDFNGRFSDKERPVEELLEQIEAVTADEIQAAAQVLELDTIYFLTAQKEA
ncbi:EF-P 5-aminopentanol modification-associated protein YfmF [Paenibacillus kandeliae]|uniref:EF-P 5-aminopentanol modification-associated protein YfmF n=1 Tax=Paenibacillus kandeliae TaxID=3231269 RepID=UPI0034576AC6